MTYISPEERKALRKLALKTNDKMKLMQVPPLGMIRLLDEIEAAETHAAEAEKQRDRLAEKLASTDRLLWPDSRYERKQPSFWLAWVAEQARSGEESNA